MEQITYSEKEVIVEYFKLTPKGEARKIISAFFAKQTYQYLFDFIATYLVNIENIKDYKLLNKYIFRYMTIALYIAFKNSKYKFLASNSLNNIIKTNITIDKLTNDIEIEEDDIWGHIFNTCNYQNEIKDQYQKDVKYPPKIDKAKETISNTFYNMQQSYYSDAALINLVSETKDKLVPLDAIICKALHQHDFTEQKKSFSLEFENDKDWRNYLLDNEHEKADLKILSFVLKEAIRQNKTNIDDCIKVESQTYYRAILGSSNGSFGNIRFIRYDSSNKQMLIDYELIDKSLYFKFNSVPYVMNSCGIHTI